MEGFDFIKAVKKMRNDDIIIACMGPTGGGKGSFTDLLFIHQLEEVQRDDVDEIQVIRIKHPNPTFNDRILLLNTPDFDNTTDGADIKITSMIKDWLKQNYTNDVSLSELIYVHNVAETNALDSLDQNLPLFGELCGWGKLSHVTLVSTMWDEVQPEVGIAREQELRSLFSRPVADNGVNIRRLERGTSEEAWEIVDSLISERDERELMLLQQRLNAFGVQLNKTEAGRELYRSFRRLVLEHEEYMQSLLARIDASDNPVELKKLRREYVGIRESFQAILKGAKGMGIRPGRLIMNPFFEWRVRARASEINNYLDLTSPAPLTNISCASEFGESTLQSLSEEAEQSEEDIDRTSSQISAALADVTNNAAVQRLITNLAGDDAQSMIEFLNYAVGREDVNARSRRQILFLMWKLAESAGVFPKYHDADEALSGPFQPTGDGFCLSDDRRASRTIKVDFQRVFRILDTGKAQKKLHGEARSPNWSGQATVSPTLSHSTDNFTASSTSGAEPSFDLLSSVLTAHAIQDLNLVPYPEGIQRPDPELNANVQKGKFRYDPDFLLQFMPLCKAKPVSLPSLDLLGIERIDDPYSIYSRKNRWRSQTTAIPNERPTPDTSHPIFSKRPELSKVIALRDPLSSGERLTDINYYLSAGGHHSPARARSGDLFAPDGTEDIQLAESPVTNSYISFLSQDVPELRDRKWATRNAVSTTAHIHEAAAKGKAAQEKGRSQRQISMSRSSPIRFGSFSELSPEPTRWTAVGKTARHPSKVDFSDFGKINKSPPTMFGPGSIFAGKTDNRETIFTSHAN